MSKARSGIVCFALLLLSLGPLQAVAYPFEFDLRDIEGVKHSAADYRGKWVIVNYWATWCPPCVEEIPELVLFHEAHKDTDAVVLGVDSEDITREKLLDFTDDFFITYPLFQTLPGASTPFGRIKAYPTTYVVSPQGEVVGRHEGGVTRETLERFMERWTEHQKKKAAKAARK